MKQKKIDSPLHAIRKKCLDCSMGNKKEVRFCVITTCPLYPYRLGHNPNRKGIGGKGIKQISLLREETMDSANDLVQRKV